MNSSENEAETPEIPSAAIPDSGEIPANQPAAPRENAGENVAENAAENAGEPTGGQPAAAEPEAPPRAPQHAPALPGLRIQIGSLGDPSVARETRAKPNIAIPFPSTEATAPESEAKDAGAATPDAPATPARPAAPAKRYPPPKLTRELSPELEMEIAEALGGMSLDDVLAGKAPAAAGGELEPESKVTGRVVSIHNDDVFFDLGAQNQGVASLRAFSEPPTVGQTIELVVTRRNAEDGLFEVSLPGAAVDVGNWEDVQEGLIVQAVITGHNKGGLECTVSNLRGFIPISQVALFRVENLEPFVGQSFACLIAEANRDRRNLVLSRRAVLEREQEENRRKKFEELAVGQTHEGIVRSLQAFGAFVDLGGVVGLIHISQMSWDRVNHPSDVLQLGQKVKVRIEKYDRTTGKIGLSYRDLADNPWNNVTSKYPSGSRHEGRVSKIMQFGAFVRLEAGVEGLIHISELSHQRVHRTSDVLKEGQEVEVQVLSVDTENQRISLSLKALEAKPTPIDREQQRVEEIMDQLEATAGAAPKKPQGPLKGGVGKSSGGEKFGLNW